MAIDMCSSMALSLVNGNRWHCVLSVAIEMSSSMALSLVNGNRWHCVLSVAIDGIESCLVSGNRDVE